LSSSEIKIPKYVFGPTPIQIKFYSVKMETDELLVEIKEQVRSYRLGRCPPGNRIRRWGVSMSTGMNARIDDRQRNMGVLLLEPDVWRVRRSLVDATLAIDRP
jgi:hypothetical protein